MIILKSSLFVENYRKIEKNKTKHGMTKDETYNNQYHTTNERKRS